MLIRIRLVHVYIFNCKGQGILSMYSKKSIVKFGEIQNNMFKVFISVSGDVRRDDQNVSSVSLVYFSLFSFSKIWSDLCATFDKHNSFFLLL